MRYDLVLDATDSMQARLDIDRATYSRRIPWIMGGGSNRGTMVSV